ncbi:MarR family transcriptional regulator [Bacillus sp. FJAT-27264]|uniref:MarR family winged helix-turn-helix transcriptional regulator n=1 Tax=Paenibacillus sp. (strain DSM 101736 / FJAT-27264) TaxID=1850362 RepID=UPI000807DABD|nr:MarR family transcriptional regulator [Bacillus sp. FJAT-27264]OBZ15710.1 MarR family transcriptional regulator [Bacillus sp. FJAT-27264]
MDKNAIFQKFLTFTAAVHQISNDLTKDVRPGDITTVQYKIMEYIAVSQPSTLSSISECMHMSMPNTSRELKKLGEKQFCEKVTDPEDRRKQYIRLSAKGEALMNEVFGRIEAQFDERLQNISEDELKELEQAIDLLHTKVFY